MHIFKISVIVGCLFACGMTYGAPAYPFSQKDNSLVIDAGATLPVVLESPLPTGRSPMTSPLLFALSIGHIRACQSSLFNTGDPDAVRQPFRIHPGSHSPRPFSVYWLSEQSTTCAPAGTLRSDSMAAVSSAILLVPMGWMKPQCSVRSPSGDSITAPQAQGPGFVGAQAPSHQIFQWLNVCSFLLGGKANSTSEHGV